MTQVSTLGRFWTHSDHTFKALHTPPPHDLQLRLERLLATSGVLRYPELSHLSLLLEWTNLIGLKTFKLDSPITPASKTKYKRLQYWHVFTLNFIQLASSLPWPCSKVLSRTFKALKNLDTFHLKKNPIFLFLVLCSMNTSLELFLGTYAHSFSGLCLFCQVAFFLGMYIPRYVYFSFFFRPLSKFDLSKKVFPDYSFRNNLPLSLGPYHDSLYVLAMTTSVSWTYFLACCK